MTNSDAFSATISITVFPPDLYLNGKQNKQIKILTDQFIWSACASFSASELIEIRTSCKRTIPCKWMSIPYRTIAATLLKIYETIALQCHPTISDSSMMGVCPNCKLHWKCVIFYIDCHQRTTCSNEWDIIELCIWNMAVYKNTFSTSP